MKQRSPNEVIHDKSMSVKLLHSAKHPFPNEVIPEGRLILFKLLQ
nr:hypothetical protein [uncultured Prevotella sp.]